MSAKTVIVTGANRGIGQAICKLILQRPDIGPLRLYAASRSGANLDLPSSNNNQQVLFPKLDITNSSSIATFADEVKSSGSHVDVLINNAGLNLDNEYSPENARRTLEVNYRGTLEMCQTFIPLMSKQGGRIVNLSSVASSLKPYSSAMQARFRDPKNTFEDLEGIAEEYLKSVASSTEDSSGFGPPQRSYSVSKGLVNAFTSLLARQNPDLLINCCCPGWIATDMGRLVGSRTVQPPKSPEEGARIPVRLGFGELEGMSGKYWANGSIRSRDSGEVQEW